MTFIRKRVTTTSQSSTGRNLTFHDNYSGNDMTRSQFVREIKNGNYPRYSVRKINNVDTPVSKPDKTVNNNLD
ncbi:hypothetical protein HMPREF0501_00469 [Limosilactobacillus coleohominis 101-4-CHN]|uniref:DUF3892 domain-containing protein n=1 Tax=Limosilactobacillus coleohominis 101-4-CHN TaxID=575594 RepID=C7XUV3_9LACO|nr:hypothetical protein [Limosilactobacillus coleohominis]EEU31064.1 hypothetical protein HMPREF0501_00469 [Limosilactobacillus coleohominis 101-4-CHN]